MLEEIEHTLKSWNEFFTMWEKELPYQLKDFRWWWFSHLLTNNLRWILAEYIVSIALGLEKKLRTERDAYDLITSNGIKIEIKSASYVQSRKQKDYSKILFSIRPTVSYDYESQKFSTDHSRQSDYYIFCILSTKDQETINPLDMNQWQFLVIPTKTLNQEFKTQKSISLSKLLKLTEYISYQELSLKLFNT